MASTPSRVKQRGRQGRVNYSSTEEKLLGFLPKGGKPISTLALVDKLYGNEPPINGRNSVLSMMNSIIRKAELNREPFTIVKTEPAGPYPVEFRKIDR